MKHIIDTIVEYLKIVAQNNNPIIIILLASTIVIIESIIPILPLALFIGINMIILGTVTGFIVSWLSTVIGCIIAFTIFKKGFSKYIYRHFDKKHVEKIVTKVKTMNFTTLVIITALPFTPAFSINIAAGLSKMSYKKFIPAMLIAKLSIVYFWGFIGKSMLESITDIRTIMQLVVLLLIGYVISKFIRHNFNLE